MADLPPLALRPPGTTGPARAPFGATLGATLPEPGAADPRRAAAQALEALFLSEMLKAAGLGETPATFGGGIGEQQFASFLRDEQARALAQQGGIGLAEIIFAAMTRGEPDGA